MARVKTKEIISGSVGEVTYRQGSDGNVYLTSRIRHRKPTRTKGTMMAQLPLGNVNAMERVLHDDVLERFEGATNRVKARGAYISINIRGRKVFMTKQMQQRLSCVLTDHTISVGSLHPIGCRLADDGCACTDIRLLEPITETTTVGDFAADLLRNNPDFRPGDILSFYYLRQIVGQSDGQLSVSAAVCHISLLPSDSTLLASQTAATLWSIDGGCLSVAEPLDGSAAAFVHKRPLADGRMLVSTQSLLCVNPLAEQYMTQDAFEAAVASRGGYTRKEPYLSPAHIANTPFDVNPEVTHFVIVSSSDPTLGTAVTGRGSYIHGTEAVLTAEPREGATFVRWTDHAGTPISDQRVFRLRVLNDGMYIANFEVAR